MAPWTRRPRSPGTHRVCGRCRAATCNASASPPVRASGGTGTIVGVSLISAADIIGAYDVVITRSSITLATENAAYAISDADALNVVAIVQLAGAYDIGNNRIGQATGIAIPYDCSGGTSLYAVTDLQLVVFVERN